MTVKMPHPKQNRKLRNPQTPIVEHAEGKKFAVYTYEINTEQVTLEGTYYDNNEAREWMEEILSTGTCAWMVSHGG
jgi:hypothetical protein